MMLADEKASLRRERRARHGGRGGACASTSSASASTSDVGSSSRTSLSLDDMCASYELHSLDSGDVATPASWRDVAEELEAHSGSSARRSLCPRHWLPLLRHGLAKRGAGHGYLPLSAPAAHQCTAAQQHAAHRLALLFALVVLLSCAMSAYFRAPSTLWPYVAFQLCALPLAMTLEGVGRVRRRFAGRRNGRCQLQLAPTEAPASSQAQPRARCGRSWTSGLWRLTLGISLVFWTWTLSPTFSSVPSPLLTPSAADAPPLFVAANLYDSAAILPRFSDALLELVALRRGRVFVSLYESNSPDGGATERLLRLLEARLKALDVPHVIRTGEEHSHAAAAPSEEAASAATPVSRSLLRRLVTKPRITKESGDASGRIRFLAAVRNEALLPLSNGLADPERLWGHGTRWDKVLWLNDVLFKSSDMARLLETNRGDYDVACAMDFGGALLGLYDTWVVRSVTGDRTKPLWPYFSDGASVASLRAQRPIRVASCWTGAAAFDARWFTERSVPPRKTPRLVPDAQRRVHDQSWWATPEGAQEQQRRLAHLRPEEWDPPRASLPHSGINASAAPAPLSMPLTFRSSARCISSECLLINLDIHRLTALASPARRPEIFINARVHVTYDAPTFWLYHSLLRSVLVRPWTTLWEQGIAQAFGKLTDLGRKTPNCLDSFRDDWNEEQIAPTNRSLTVEAMQAWKLKSLEAAAPQQ